MSNLPKNRILKGLKDYYLRRGILSTHLNCPYSKICGGSNKKFYGPKSAFVSAGYEMGVLPRLLFVSLDPGFSEKNPDLRLPESVRETEENIDVNNLVKNRHWYRTHELAYFILRRFKEDLSINDVKHFFAHVNTVKCSMNNPHNKQAGMNVFQNCRTYLHDEISVLNPDIIVTQGLEAKKALENILPKAPAKPNSYHQLIKLSNKEVFWLHTIHPSNYGAFYKQYRKGKGWDRYSGLIFKWYSKK